MHLEKHLQGNNLVKNLAFLHRQHQITILTDNQSVAENPANYRRAKHIDIRYHAIRHYLRNHLITVDYVPSNAQAADILTKALGPLKHHECVQLLGLRNSYEN